MLRQSQNAIFIGDPNEDREASRNASVDSTIASETSSYSDEIFTKASFV